MSKSGLIEYNFGRLDCTTIFAGIAQLAVHLTCNEKVGGSSPSTSSSPPAQRGYIN